MLKIIYDESIEYVYDTADYFDNTFEPEWLESELAKKMIKDVDQSEVLSPYCIESPVLGQIPPTMLSGGVKTLLLMLNDDSNIYNASTCGDNCAKWMLEIGKIKDVTVCMYHFVHFGKGEFEIEVLPDGVVMHNERDLMRLAYEYLDG